MSESTQSGRFRRTLIGILGGLVVLLGIITIPYPGPGWLIVFAGLGILSTEFDWAQRTLSRVRAKYDAWQEWVEKQRVWVRIALGAATFALVVLTVYLVNGYGIMNSMFNLDQDWLVSPFFA